MVSVAAAMAIAYNRKCLVTQTHYNLNNLESYLIGNRENNKNVYMDMGLDGLTSIIKLRAIDKSTIENYSIPLLNKYLTLVPGTTGGNKKTFIDDMGKTATRLLIEMNKYYEMVFVDVNSGSDEVSRLILDIADIIVVNLCQNKSVLDNYMKSWLMMNRKVMYLFGNYDRNSTYNLHNLRMLYKPFSKGCTAVIPYNAGFMDAQSDGCVIKYMKKNMAVIKNDSNNYFIDSVKDAAEKLIRLSREKRGGVI
jgi:CO dehydrogenase nickel-insertion accessory protein CooC1